MVEHTEFDSYVVGELPEGCRLCTQGAKLVLFATGLCSRNCYYCPLSPQRKGKDLVLANERPVNNDQDILEEARVMDALGTGITGGDPMVVPERTLRVLSLLKSEFGSSHHVHLYTAETGIGNDVLGALGKRGLDELRFHARLSHRDVISRAVAAGLNVGVEIPSIPGEAERMKRVASMADRCGCKFMNLNELEVCSTTAEAFRERGLRVVSDESSALEGSLEDALEVADFCQDSTSLDVHVCPSSLKDRFQLRNRLGRMAKNVLKPYEAVDEDNLLVKTLVSPRSGEHAGLGLLTRRIMKELSLEDEMVYHDAEKGVIEAPPHLARNIADLVDSRRYEVSLVEEYPSWDRLRTEKIPLN